MISWELRVVQLTRDPASLISHVMPVRRAPQCYCPISLPRRAPNFLPELIPRCLIVVTHSSAIRNDQHTTRTHFSARHAHRQRQTKDTHVEQCSVVLWLGATMKRVWVWGLGVMDFTSISSRVHHNLDHGDVDSSHLAGAAILSHPHGRTCASRRWGPETEGTLQRAWPFCARGRGAGGCRALAPRLRSLTSSETRNITLTTLPLTPCTRASHQQSASLTSTISPICARRAVRPQEAQPAALLASHARARTRAARARPRLRSP